jgi:hypothetical protein
MLLDANKTVPTKMNGFLVMRQYGGASHQIHICSILFSSINHTVFPIV